MRVVVAGSLAVGTSVALMCGVAFAQDREDLKTTALVSTSMTGGIPNGPSRNAAVSTDGRFSRIFAFESDASNIVAGDTNGQTDVFARFRGGFFANEGEPWQPGEMRLVSQGLDGQPANGRSYMPAVDGSPNLDPHCIAFVSDASNLVEGDTNGKPDAFLYDTQSQRISRVSVDSAGRQSNGSTYDVAVDSRCNRIAFTSDATNLALTGVAGIAERKRRAWQGTVSTNGGGMKQVYVHILGARASLDNSLAGLTFLASASNGRRAGQGDSFDPSFPGAKDDVIAFTSTAALSATDANGASDVYVRQLDRVLSRRKHGAQHTVGSLRLRTELVSATQDGAAGNGPSSAPSTNGRGDFVFYQTDATDLLPIDTNGVTDAVRANRDESPPRQEWVSRNAQAIGNGPSTRPCASAGGTNAVFQSAATNFLVESNTAGGVDTNGVQDIFIWTVNRHLAILESRRNNGTLLGSASSNCALSARTNYILFETNSGDASPAFGTVNPAAANANQVYVRYLGPREVN